MRPSAASLRSQANLKLLIVVSKLLTGFDAPSCTYTDPRFYAQMSKLLDDLIKQSRADTAAYEEFLRRAEDLVKRLASKQPEAGIPAVLHGRHEAFVLYNNLDSIPATSFRYPTSDEERRQRWP